MRGQIFAVFLIGLVATHALPVPEEVDLEKSNPIADIEAPENLEPKSIAQDESVNLEPKAVVEALESLEPKADIQAAESLEQKADIQAPESLETKADIQAPESLEPKTDIEAPESLEPKADIQAPESLEPKAVLTVDNSLEPIAEEMRSVISSANDALNNMAEEVKSVAGRALDYAKELTAPLNSAERANIATSLAERALDVYGKMQADAKNLLDRTLQNTDILGLSGRSAFPGLGEFARFLQEKYLTIDGQRLLKVMLSFTNM